MKKILIIATVQRHIIAFHIPIIKLLQSQGYEVHIATKMEDSSYCNLAEVVWHNIAFARSPLSLRNILALFQLIRLMKGERFALIHVHTPVAAFIGRLVAKLTGCNPILYTAHGFHFYRGAPLLNWLVYFSAEYLAARWTDGLVVINSEDYSSAFKLGFRESQDVFFTNGVGVELEPFLQKVQSADIRKQLGLKETDVVITCVAELNKNKNQKYLIKSWETIAREVPNSHIWLVGDGPMRELLQTEIAEQYISRVHFLGFRSDIPNILACTDIVCLVSQREGLPKCIMEAMAAGKPVIATNIRGNRDLVSHGQTGYLVDIGDEGKLAFYLRKLAEDEKLRKLMGQHASEMIKSYSIENVLGQMSDIYAHYLEA